jgi:uncharacterized membrane protein YdjX (TVP38/TMEM64 family)
MSDTILMAGGLIGLTGILVFAGMRLRILSVGWATILMMIVSVIAASLTGRNTNGHDTVATTCTGLLLAATFGFWTFVFGRALERQRDRQQK